MQRIHFGLGLAVIALYTAVGCGGDNSSGGPPTGQACSSATQCYPGIDPATIQGTVTCLNVTGGYCTHTCVADTDCCTVNKECAATLVELCSPFQSTNQQYCFISCESKDLTAAGYTDESAFCHHFASAAFTCRSTGGGSLNRKVCAP